MMKKGIGKRSPAMHIYDLHISLDEQTRAELVAMMEDPKGGCPAASIVRAAIHQLYLAKGFAPLMKMVVDSSNIAKAID